MNSSIRLKEKGHVHSKIHAIISVSFSENKNMFLPVLQETGFCIISEGTNYIIYDNNSEYILTASGNFNELFGEFIENFIVKSKIDYETAYQIIDAYKSHLPDDKQLNKMYALLSWPGSSKGHEYFETYAAFSSALRALLNMKKIGLNEAFFFHTTFKSNYDMLLELLTKEGSFTDNNTRLRLSWEIARQNHADTEKLIEILSSEEETEASVYGRKLNDIRYRTLNTARKKMDDFIQAMGLPSYAKISTDTVFEKNTNMLHVSFTTSSDLRNKLMKLCSITDKLPQTDLFDYKTLFNSIKDTADE